MADASQFTSPKAGIAAIRASIVALVAKELATRSGKTDVFLAGHGILRSQLSDPYALIPLFRYVSIFEEAADMLRDPALGVRIGATFGAADIGPTGLLFSGSATIRRAFERLSQFINAVQGSTSAGLVDEKGDRVVWSYGLTDPRIWPRRQDAEFTLAASCRLVRQSFGSTWRPIEIHFEHGPPRDDEPLRRIFDAAVLFSQPGNRIVMAKADVDRRYRTEDPHLVAVLERHIGDLIEGEAPGDSLSIRVGAVIGMHLGHKSITIDSIAAELSLSKRTLQRRLTEEGTSLRDLVRRHRQDMAERHLTDKGLGNTSIAEALGYADSTVFGRAYKSWTGQPPSGRRR